MERSCFQTDMARFAFVPFCLLLFGFPLHFLAEKGSARCPSQRTFRIGLHLLQQIQIYDTRHLPGGLLRGRGGSPVLGPIHEPTVSG